MEHIPQINVKRLYLELRNNVALRVSDTDSTDSFIVSGRGELHLAILIETMRREGYEFQISKPEAIFKQGENGEILEPFEEVHIENQCRYGGECCRNAGKPAGVKCWI